MSAGEVCQERKGFNVGLIAFIPFGTLLINLFHRTMPLRWVSLASLLKSVSLLSIYANVTRNDILWTIFGVWTFITVCTTVYLNIAKTPNPVGIERNNGSLSFAGLFKMCSNGVFSDYRIALLAKIPLVVQVLAAGSVLYQVFGIDWLMHGLAGFGVGAAALKAYKTAVDRCGYGNLVSYFRLDRFQIFKVERKTGSLEFTLFGLVVAALIWELIERVAYFVSPANLLRIGAEPVWNVFGDIIFDIIGGVTAWALISSKLKWF